MNQDSYKLLGACAEIVEHPTDVCDPKLKDELKTCLEVNEHLQKEISAFLKEGKAEDLSAENTDAELLTRKCYDSIVKMGKALARYPKADVEAKDTVRKLIAAKEQMVYHLRPYL